MKITLKSVGKAKLKPNWVKTGVPITIKSTDKELCGKTLINTIGNLTDELKNFVEEVVFSSYHIQEVTKQVKEKQMKDNQEVEVIKRVFDYYEGFAILYIEFKLDMKKMQDIDDTCKELSKAFTNGDVKTDISTYHEYTLSEESFSELDSMVVNNALDKMIIQANKIAEHMNYKKVELKEVSFVKENIRGDYDYLGNTFDESSRHSIKEYKLSDLDAILELKEIERSTEVYSNWEME